MKLRVYYHRTSVWVKPFYFLFGVAFEGDDFLEVMLPAQNYIDKSLQRGIVSGR
jgi:hypothetical protein